ncbi:MAG: twin-arginine translocase TatA/TatE family subunit [Chloroflexota bacterium]
MFGFGHGPELIIILVIALIVLGPGKIPEVAQMLGKGIRELRQASSDLQKTFDVQELMNPTPAPPPSTPPVEASPAPPTATTETILPPTEAPAKPKRIRKRATPHAEGSAFPSPAATGESQGEGATSADHHPLPPAGEGTVAAVPEARPAARRRRPSKKTSEPVSLDAPGVA